MNTDYDYSDDEDYGIVEFYPVKTVDIRMNKAWKDEEGAHFLDIARLAAKSDRAETEYLLRKLGMQDLISEL